MFRLKEKQNISGHARDNVIFSCLEKRADIVQIAFGYVDENMKFMYILEKVSSIKQWCIPY